MPALNGEATEAHRLLEGGEVLLCTFHLNQPPPPPPSYSIVQCLPHFFSTVRKEIFFCSVKNPLQNWYLMFGPFLLSFF